MKKVFLILSSFYLIISCNKDLKPNILWITIEDQSQYLLPFNGNDDIKLPNLQKIAEESLIFNNMYAPYPVCAPARSSIITGMYPTTIGTQNMRAYKKNTSSKQNHKELPFYSPIPKKNIGIAINDRLNRASK